NLAFRSEIVVARKHTRFGADRFAEAIAQAVGNLSQFQQAEAQRIERFRQAEIPDTTAESLILRAYEREIISHYLLPRVLADWRKPTHEAFASRTLWSLENVFTGVLAHVGKSNPQRFCSRCCFTVGRASLAPSCSMYAAMKNGFSSVRPIWFFSHQEQKR